MKFSECGHGRPQWGGAKRAFALPGNRAKKENSLENVKSAI